MERRALPPASERFVSEFSLDELTPPTERRSLLLTLRTNGQLIPFLHCTSFIIREENSPWEFNRYRIGH